MIEKAITEIAKLKAALPKKIESNEKLLEQLKASLKEIDGDFFVPTGFEDLSVSEISDMLTDYTLEEIQTVLTQWGNDCEISQREPKQIERVEVENIGDIIKKTAPPFIPPNEKDCDKLTEDKPKKEIILNPFIPFTQKEIIDSACDCKCETPQLKTPIEKITSGNPNPNKVLADDLPQQNLSLDDMDDFVNTISEPNNIIIFGTIDATITDIPDNITNINNCNMIILKTSEGDIPAGVSQGELVKVFVKIGDNINGKELFEIKKQKGESVIEKTFEAVKKQSKGVNKLISLKEDLGNKEREFYFSEIQKAFYEYRFTAYSNYFNKFSPKVNSRKDKNDKLKNLKRNLSFTENRINNIFKTGNLIPVNLNTESLLKKLVSQREKTLNGIKKLIKDINQLTGEINNIRKGQNFFAKETSETISEIINGGNNIKKAIIRIDGSGKVSESGHLYKNPLIRKTQVETFQPESDVVNVTEAYAMAKNLQTVIERFSNEFALNGKNKNEIHRVTLSTYNPILKLQGTTIENPDDAGSWRFAKIKSKGIRLSGSYHQIRVDFYNFIINSTDKEKGDPEWLKELQVRDENIEPETDLKIQSVIDEMRIPAEQYGHIAINQDQVYLNPQNKSTFNEFERAYNTANKLYNKNKKIVENLRLEIKEIEEATKNLKQDIQKISDDCDVYKSCATELRCDITYKLCSWPIEKIDEDAKLVKDDLTYRNNPRPVDESPPLNDISWWQKFCSLASIINIIPIYWPVGLIIPAPALIKIPLPVIWIPITTITTPAALIVIGIAQAGILPCPFVFVLNTTDTPLGPVSGNSCWFVGAIRPLQKIKDNPGTEIMPIAPKLNIGLNTIDVLPDVTKLIPFIKDDFPAYERLSLLNFLLLLFLTKWCSAGKKGEGFFENP